MTQGTSLPASVELFNLVIKLAGPFDAEMAEPLIWRAKSLDRKSPNDFATKVAFARVLLVTGQRELAEEQLHASFALRNIEDHAAYSELAHLLCCIGDYKRAGQVTRELVLEISTTVPHIMSNAARYALCSGDVKLLKEIAELNNETADLARVALFTLNEGGLVHHLEAHQNLVHEILGDGQIWIDVTHIMDEEGDITIFMEHVLLGNSSFMREVQRNLVNTLADYYESQGMAPGVYLPFLDSRITALPRQPAAAIA